MKSGCVALVLALCSGVAAAQTTKCDMSGYKAVPGVGVDSANGAVVISWPGERGDELRANFALHAGQPVVEELTARKPGGKWVVLGNDLTPDFEVTTGKRRMASTEIDILKKFHRDTPANQEFYKWNVFWDAPLEIPGTENKHLVDGPRLPEEVTRGTVSYRSDACSLSSDGDQVSLTFNGLALGIFAGKLRFTVYKGSNLLRQEAMASTERPDVAFIYKAGLKGFTIHDGSRLAWRDTSEVWQEQGFGGEINQQPVNLKARNRVEILDAGAGSVAVFPPPHKFFFARENEVNLGYVYYRKDSSSSFSLGVMQPERGQGYAPWGVSDAVWKHRVAVARSQIYNYALYNAPPGTVQHMAVYYYLSPEGDRATLQDVLAYTHGDVFKPLPGFKTLTGHFHLDLNEMVRDRGTSDFRPNWVSVFRGLGINIVYLGDFHDDSDGNDPGPKRLPEQKDYFEASAKLSDRNFLVMPAEEVNAFLGGHWYLLLPRPVYFSRADPRPASQSYEESDPVYGKVFHLGSAADVTKFLEQQNGIIWVAHPRTKSSTLYPDLYKDQPFFLSDRFIGGSWESLPVDLSQKRLCPVRCFGLMDEMSDWAPKPKFMIAEGDTYMKAPGDDSYSSLAVNYLKLDKVPAYNQSWAPIVDGMRAGNFFGTTGEILFHNWGIDGSGAKSVYTASIEYTFPLQFAELVWSDGSKVDRKIVSLTGTEPFGTRTFRIPFDARGKKWVRFDVWDTAGNGAWLQPVAPKQ